MGFGVLGEQDFAIQEPEPSYWEKKPTSFFRFEGESDPDDNAILYVIETTDGLKGTLIDAYGVYNDQRVTQFMKDVNMIQKKVIKN